MSASTETIALKVLSALKMEWEREPSLLKCRPMSEVLGPLKGWRRMTDADIDRGIKYLVSLRVLQAVKRADGMAAIPSNIGLTLLAEDRKKSTWTMERRLTLYGLVFTILTALVRLIAKYCSH